MALTSPGVEVSIIDESQYLPAPTNSVPLIVLATAQNKADASGTSVAQATTAANAGKLYQITSQRDLVNLYGSPFFYTSSNGSPIQGYELNEYGLLAAYSLLGVTNRCYILRANVDLASLVGTASRPSGKPADGTYWLDSASSTWGIYEFNAVTSKFVAQDPIVITDVAQLSGLAPLSSIGNIGDYAVDATDSLTSPLAPDRTYFRKGSNNTWVAVGSPEWTADIPTVQGTISNPTLTVGDSFTLTTNYGITATITFSAATVASVATAINALGYSTLTAKVRDGRLCIFSAYQTSNASITLASANGGLTSLGLTANTFYQPAISYGNASQMPLWTTGQSQPRPSQSVWIKVGAVGSGLNPVLSKYNASTKTWDAKSVSLSTSNWGASAALDPTGGQAIPAGTIYGQYDFDSRIAFAPLYLWARSATGPTVVTGTVKNPSNTAIFTHGPYNISVLVSVPGSTSLTTAYPLTLANNATFTDFVTAWTAAGIPYTNVSITPDGALQLTHTEGGEIVINDADTTTFVSTGLAAAAGFNAMTTTGCTWGPIANYRVAGATQSTTSGTGTGASLNVVVSQGTYQVETNSFANPGTGYVVGNTITVTGNKLGGVTGTNDLVVKVTGVTGGVITSVAYVSGTAAIQYTTQLSNWVDFTYVSGSTAPTSTPVDSTNWFNSTIDQVDIMVNRAGVWTGYRNTSFDANGFPLPSGTNATDPAGPIVAATAPTTQSDSTPLVYGDLWIDSSDLDNYPLLSRWQSVSGVDQWVRLDTTDQTSSTGVLFADARWGSSGSIDPVSDAIPTIASLLTSNYIDLDAPSASLYPTGMLLFNTRRSGYTVKQFKKDYFTYSNYSNAGAYNSAAPTVITNLPKVSYTWVTVSGNKSNGAAYMGRKAQRAVVVQAMRAALDINTSVRDEDNFFNLIAAPNYPELQPNMITLNADRGETAYIIGDTPMRLRDDATAIQNWATNAVKATSTGEDGLVNRNTYLGLFYPSGIASDLSGNSVAVPASHMMLRTFLRNDTVAYPWLAAAGTRRGTIDNALNIGYVDSTTGEFQTVKTRVGIRDVLYTNQINPAVFFTGVGLLNYGNKTSYASTSALDRTNVARLVAYIRRQLTIATRPFVFEQNDSLTRQQITSVVESLFVDLVAKRGVYDYVVVCDETNNTPARIDRNELWVDVAVAPAKTVDFIYIPVRIVNTGALTSSN